MQSVYFHIEDDDGWAPTEGVMVTLMFEPNGIGTLCLKDDSDALAFAGTWKYEHGKMALKFESDEFNIDACFPLDLNDNKVTMPFRVFSSEEAGTSRWERRAIHIVDVLYYSFYGAVASGCNPIEARKRAVDYGNTLIEMASSEREGSYNYSYLGNRNAVLAAPIAKSGMNPSIHVSDWLEKVTVTYDSCNVITLVGKKGITRNLTLWNFSPPACNPLVLERSLFLLDPRVHINCAPTGNKEFDPPVKSALIYMPLADQPMVTWKDERCTVATREVISSSGEKEEVKQLFSTGWRFDEIRKTLEDPEWNAGYEVKIMKNTENTEGVQFASLDWFIAELTRETPGILVVSSHGSADGYIYTGSNFGCDKDEANQLFDKLKDNLIRNGYNDLVNSGGIRLDYLATTLCKNTAFVTVGPAFWVCLREKYCVNFNHSLVYIDACMTDAESYLRCAIKAGAYFAFNKAVTGPVSGRIFEYLVKSLAHPTWSAEEAYYNLVRVVNSERAIYKHDYLSLNGVKPCVAEPDEKNLVRPTQSVGLDLFNKSDGFHFNGYGNDGSGKMVRYYEPGNGWLRGPDIDLGQVWMLLSAGRWGQNPEQGVQNLKECWDKYWKEKKLPVLAEQGICRHACAGKPPSESDVAYAIYLLTGDKTSLTYSGVFVPRWTLNETRPWDSSQQYE